ncbi:hypothetical protein COR50_06265 [Chitinophaga caeni]|uniref:CAAX prenyl protease 2/Lysostaphin resistance protein A-like domain-containing protein n=1 Tax=Chitinophaga caeni TaxID=2029983 RepID=A0A291QSG4_9BACT|nr:type II CAAX endopeptidase family protein [Chitinophaga caeni]ATL46813.1 hypothetical protein COR50_06265 [Chitinophaga caeni]
MYIQSNRGVSLAKWLALSIVYLLGLLVSFFLEETLSWQDFSFYMYIFLGWGVFFHLYFNKKVHFKFIPRFVVSPALLMLTSIACIGYIGFCNAVSNLEISPQIQLLDTFTVRTDNIFQVFGSVILIAFLEEFIFRGMVLPTLMKQYHAGIALVLSAILYTAIHLEGQHILELSLFGLISGSLYIALKDLCMCIYFHLLRNVILAICSVKGISMPIIYGTNYQEIIGILLISLIMLVFSILVIYSLGNKLYDRRRVDFAIR